MPSVHRSLIVPYDATQMFALVHDIERYPEFVPWCEGAEVLARDDESVTARLLLSRGPSRSHFSTRNRYVHGERIDMELMDGPFHYLRGRWCFEDDDDGSEVSLELDYQFSNLVLGLVFDPAVRGICTELVAAFEGRAEEVYGG